MAKVAFIFPGQGSQAVGMGKALAESHAVARAVFEEVDEALGDSLTKIMWEGEEEDLKRTRNTQPALMATGVAALRVLAQQGVKVGEQVAYVAGHSLGEYGALVAAGVLELGEAARVLRLRGEAMQAAVEEGAGAMLALVGLDVEAVEPLVAEVAAQGYACQIAGDNAPGQVVVSGAKEGVEKVKEAATAAGVRRAVPLAVSAPFHCPLMLPAAEKLAEALGGVKMGDPRVPVVANVRARPMGEGFKDLLVEQVVARVRWRESMLWMGGEGGVNVFLELGAGKVLTGMVKRTVASCVGAAVAVPEDVAGAVELANG